MLPQTAQIYSATICGSFYRQILSLQTAALIIAYATHICTAVPTTVNTDNTIRYNSESVMLCPAATSICGMTALATATQKSTNKATPTIRMPSTQRRTSRTPTNSETTAITRPTSPAKALSSIVGMLMFPPSSKYLRPPMETTHNAARPRINPKATTTLHLRIPFSSLGSDRPKPTQMAAFVTEMMTGASITFRDLSLVTTPCTTHTLQIAYKEENAASK